MVKLFEVVFSPGVPASMVETLMMGLICILGFFIGELFSCSINGFIVGLGDDPFVFVSLAVSGVR